MFSSIVAAFLLVYAFVFKEPLCTIAAGLFEIAGVIYSVTRPRRLAAPKNKEEVIDG